MTTQSIPFFQRRILIAKRFQLRYSLTLAGAGALVGAIGGALMYLALRSVHESLPLPDDVRALVAQQDVVFLGVFGASSVLVLAGLAYLGLLLSHRIAGPLYVMTRYLAELAEGKYPSVRPLRKGDELKALFDLIQKVAEFHRARDVEESYRLRDALDVLAPLAQTKKAQEAIAELKALEERKRV